MPGLPQQRDRLQPPEDLLHELALLLADRVARVPRRAPVDGTAPVRGVLGDMRGDAPGPERRDEVAGVVALVGPEGGARSQAADQRPRRLALGRPGGQRHAGPDRQPMPILHEDMPVVAELGFPAPAFAHQPRLGIGRRDMGGIRAPLAMEIHRGIARIIRRRGHRVAPREALEPGPGLDQRPVDREMLGREQLPGLRLLHDGREEGLGDVPAQQAFPVLGEHGHIPDRGIQAQPHEPPIEDVEVQLLHELPLAPDRVQRLEQQGAEELLGRDGRSPGLRVQPGKATRA